MNKNSKSFIVNPFSDNFLATWQIWKDYKKETFGFEYKGLYSEQMTLKKLCELADGDEEKAIRIIEQSIMRQWQGIFPLHIPSNNGKTSKKSTTNSKESNNRTGNLKSRVQTAFTKRYGGGGQAGDEPHLKAV